MKETSRHVEFTRSTIELNMEVKEDAEVNDTAGEIIAAHKRTKRRPATTAVVLAPVGILPGRLCVLHGPRQNGYTFDFREVGVTHVVTLLNNAAEERRARVVEKQAREQGAEWIWIPLQGANPPLSTDFPIILEAMQRLREALQQDGTGVLIHCSAGLHRTGMIANALLRFIGHDAGGALEVIRLSREQTASGVGNHRLAWADEFLAWTKKSSE